MPIMFLLFVGAAAFLAGRSVGRGERFGGDGGGRQPPSVEIYPAHRVIGAGPGGGPRFDPARPGPRLPSPNRVLDEVVRMHKFPPPFLVQACFDEARACGDEARCQYIVGAFMAPIVEAARAAQAKNGAPDAQGTPPGGVPSGPSPSGPQSPPAPPTSPISVESDGGAGPAAGAADRDAANGWTAPNGDRTVAIDGPPLPGVLVEPPAGIAREPWVEFAAALECEAPDFVSNRHVGRYRHNRQRLAELGIDASVLVGADPTSSLVAQDGALAMDVADACARAQASGLAQDFVGQSIDVPSDGGDMSVAVTLSGVLGVCQVAGVAGAAGWLTQPGDRRRFPHTTAAFWRANGVF